MIENNFECIRVDIDRYWSVILDLKQNKALCFIHEGYIIQKLMYFLLTLCCYSNKNGCFMSFLSSHLVALQIRYIEPYIFIISGAKSILTFLYVKLRAKFNDFLYI